MTNDAIIGAGNTTVSNNSFTYDGAANILSKTDAIGTTSKYSYNNVEQLTSYAVGSGGAQAYKYYPNRMLANRSIGVTSTQFYYDNNQHGIPASLKQYGDSTQFFLT